MITIIWVSKENKTWWRMEVGTIMYKEEVIELMGLVLKL